MLKKLSFIQEAELCEIFSKPGYYGLFTLHLTLLSAENRRKAIEGMKVYLRAIEGSFKKKNHTKKRHFLGSYK